MGALCVNRADELAPRRRDRQPSLAMKPVRVIGLSVFAVLAGSAAWLALRDPPAPPQAPAPVPTREVFHVAKPLGVAVIPVSPETEWLAGELRHLLIRGKMQVAALQDPTVRPYVLRVALNDGATEARVTLVAPDNVEERDATFSLAKDSRLATLRSFAERLPAFLGAPGDASAWLEAAGTNDAGVYDAYLSANAALLDPNAVGFSAPPPPSQATVQTLERVETLARRNRDFARARALLSLAYLSVGGDDQASLAKLSETAAERALTANPELADAHAALGIVRLRRMDWSAAHEHFNAALAIDANSTAALEGLGCLLLDMGHTQAALPHVTRAVALQPGNRGARQCAAYAAVSQQQLATHTDQSFDTAKIHAAMLLLNGDRNGAESLLRSSFKSNELIDAVVTATTTKERTAEALQAITRSADEELIDAETEMLFGTALRRPDFVFNRMLRLAKQDEAVPLRLLWLPQTDFLRRHRRFKEVVSATSLTTYWQDHGVPDICTPEPKVAGCAAKPK
jgi:tetratricopeptide (TPR) repeat protein